MRVAFLGSQEIGARCLEVVLRAGHDVVGVGAFAPEEHESWSDDVTRLVESRGLPRLSGRRFRTERAVRELRDLAPDILFAIGWRWILPRAVLDLPPKGCLGIHGSLLPRLRGFAPVNWALIRDEPRTGPTLFYFDEGTDTGDVVGQRAFDISDDDDARTVRSRLVEESAALLGEFLAPLAEGNAPRVAQSEEGATYGARRRPEDGEIDWELGPREVFNWVRGLTRPYPGAFTWLAGRKVLVWRSRPFDGEGSAPAAPWRGAPAGRLVVGCGPGLLEILDAGFEGDDSPGPLLRVAESLSEEGGFSSSPRGGPSASSSE
jgi:methionyl-tRNA formyltransferase